MRSMTLLKNAFAAWFCVTDVRLIIHRGLQMSERLVIAHIPSCPWIGKGHSDSAKRISDATFLHYVANGWDAVGKFIACRLSDGKGGETLYDSHYDAVRMHPNESDFYCYIKLRFEGMSVCDAEIFLNVARKAHDAGFRLTDPDKRSNNRTIIPRVDRSHNIKIARSLRGR